MIAVSDWIPTMEAEKIHTVVEKLPYESSVTVTLC